MTIYSFRLAVAIAVVAIAMGCAGPDKGAEKPNPVAPVSAASAAGAGTPVNAQPTPGGPAGVVPGTPAGGLRQWIDDVESGLRDLPQVVKRDPATAKNQALQLYVTRQEYIEIYYGAAGRAAKDPVLAEAVTTAETRFHDLLRVLNPPDGRVAAEAVPGAVRALHDEYGRVLQRARALGVDLGRVEIASGAAS